MSNKRNRLHVPPPPARPVSHPRPGSKRRRKRSGTPVLAGALIVTLGLLFLWICVLIVGLPLVLSGDGGGRV